MTAFSFIDLLSNKIHLNDVYFVNSQGMLSDVYIAQAATEGKMQSGGRWGAKFFVGRFVCKNICEF